MRLLNIVLLLFLLSAFSIGIALSGEADWNEIDSSIDNASNIIENVTITTEYSGSNLEGFFLVVEKYIHFIGFLAMEVLRVGVKFGYENPSYFTPENIIYVMKLIVWLLVISLLIRPLGYLIIFIILGFMWLKNKFQKKKKNDKKITNNNN